MPMGSSKPLASRQHRAEEMLDPIDVVIRVVIRIGTEYRLGMARDVTVQTWGDEFMWTRWRPQ